LGRERESVCGRETYKEREIERDRKREREWQRKKLSKVKCYLALNREYTVAEYLTTGTDPNLRKAFSLLPNIWPSDYTDPQRIRKTNHILINSHIYWAKYHSEQSQQQDLWPFATRKGQPVKNKHHCKHKEGPRNCQRLQPP
jgi:hypothetical protein